jgi:hypothetical protein
MATPRLDPEELVAVSSSYATPTLHVTSVVSFCVEEMYVAYSMENRGTQRRPFEERMVMIQDQANELLCPPGDHLWSGSHIRSGTDPQLSLSTALLCRTWPWGILFHALSATQRTSANYLYLHTVQ